MRTVQLPEDVGTEILSYNTTRREYMIHRTISNALKPGADMWLTRNPLIVHRRFGEGEPRVRGSAKRPRRPCPGSVLPTDPDMASIQSLTFVVEPPLHDSDLLTAEIDWEPYLPAMKGLKIGADTFTYVHYRALQENPRGDEWYRIEYWLKRLPQETLDSIPGQILVLGMSLPIHDSDGYNACHSMDADDEKYSPVNLDHVIYIADHKLQPSPSGSHLANYVPRTRNIHQNPLHLSIILRASPKELEEEAQGWASLLSYTAETKQRVTVVLDSTTGYHGTCHPGSIIYTREQVREALTKELHSRQTDRGLTGDQVRDMDRRFEVKVMGEDQGADMDEYERVMAKHRDVLAFVDAQ